MGVTKTDKFNLELVPAASKWKDAKTLRAEAWFKADQHSKFMEGRVYDYDNKRKDVDSANG